MLIEACVCGETSFRHILGRNGLRIHRCVCGVEHLVSELTPAEYFEQYRGAYHASLDRHAGVVPYAQRYDHDYGVAGLRWKRYAEILGEERLRGIRTALDIGCAAGAFVDYLRDRGIAAGGIDPDPAMAREYVTTGTARSGAASGQFDLVTMHDVLEHVVDPAAELEIVAELVCPAGARPPGILIVDVPDVSVPEGLHHYKAEHPWYFTAAALEALLERAGLAFVCLDKPLPGKMVAYAIRP